MPSGQTGAPILTQPTSSWPSSTQQSDTKCCLCGNHLGAFSSFTMAPKTHKDLQDLLNKPTLPAAK